MKRFTDAGRKAIAEGNLYAALTIALTLPDICGSLEDPGPGKSQKRYERWCKKWIEPRFTRASHVFISAENLFQLRCSLIHSGSAEIEPAKRSGVDRFVFFDATAGAHLNVFNNCEFFGEKVNLVQLKADLFSEEVFQAADEWDASVASDPDVQAEKAKLLYIHTKGDSIHGVRFG